MPLQATGAIEPELLHRHQEQEPGRGGRVPGLRLQQEAGEIALKTGVMPFNGTFEKPAEAGALLADELAELNAVQETDGFVPYFDWASPTMLDTLGAQTQLLLAGKITPDQLVEACQKDYDAFRKSQGK